MDKFVIQGGQPLNGTVKISGAKNASLALLPVVLLAPGIYRLHNTPDIRDIWSMSRLLTSMGAHCELNSNEMFVDSTNVNSTEAPYEHVKKMRASINVLGPLLGRYGQAKVSLPGGCAFGPRPVDLHLKGFEKLGARIEIENGYIIATSDGLKGANINFDISSVGATENVVTAAVLAQGTTVMTNCAIEPEVTALCKMLTKMGAKIDGIGTSTLTIEGVKDLKAVDEHNIPDRIEVATFLIATAVTGGKVRLENTNPYHVAAVISKLEETGAEIEVMGHAIEITADGNPKPVDITTNIYPGYPTDAQAQWIALMMKANGTSRVTDAIYPTRFHHVPEMQRVGADIELFDNTAIVKGGKPLTGATVMSSDLRASASLILAGLAAEGTTEVLRVYHLDRGYEHIETKLQALGANIQRVKTEDY